MLPRWNPDRLRGLAIRSALTLAVGLAAAAPTMFHAQPANAESAPVRGGTMTIINGSDIKTWDPSLTGTTYPGGPMDVLDAIYGFLVYVNDKGVVTGGMAESLTSTDATTWTLKLRKGMKFTDGTAFDAEAVKYNWDRTADPATLAPTQAWVASWNKSMTVVDAQTLTIKLNTPNSNFAAQVAELCPFIASPTALKAAKDKTDIKPIGAGAFTLTSWNQGISMDMARNPDYWDQPRPYLDTIKFAIIPETNSRIATVVQGGATMMAGYPFQFGSNATAPGVTTHEIPIRGFNRGFFNQVKGPFTDVRAREAFYTGIDRGRLAQALTQTPGQISPTNYFGKNSPYFDAAYSLPAYNPAKAQALFAALKAEGKPLDFKIVTYTNSDLKRMAAYIQQVLTGYDGVTAKIIEVDQASLNPRCRVQLDFDICLEGGALISNGAEPNISNLLSSKGAFNWGQYNSPEMDKALALASSTVDQNAIKAAYSTVQKLMVTDFPFYMFGEQSRFLLLRDNAGGIVPSNGGILQKQFLFVCSGPCQK